MYKKEQKVYLIGMGMGTQDTVTKEANQCLEECDWIIGSKRIVQSVKSFKKPVFLSHKPEEILEFLQEKKEQEKFAILFSGDSGFYSGAKRLVEVLEDQYEVIIIPGISSFVYFAGKLKTSWEDAEFVSLHGRETNYIYSICHSAKTFLLLGDQKKTKEFCEKLKYYNLTNLEIWVGQNLSSEQEKIFKRDSKSLAPEELKGLTVLMIRNPNPDKRIRPHISDEEFIRGSVPMTKGEIRSLIMDKLQLKKDSILYDIGAGTGSISIEAALQGMDVKVFAIEKKEEACKLIRENCRQFRVDNVKVIAGYAPEAYGDLEKPTHVFIGGSSGNMKEILEGVKTKNPKVRIVLTAITLESLNMALEAEKAGILEELCITQVNVSSVKTRGAYHMMQGENPIFIISEGE
ncbi:precorrin-6Y C5,15-methyltransferase (decarboxylating) [Aequitasia blattaphilus]|uniref:Precorrin-6y C5,15-methyltransferase (Decarboxylating) subunit CbiE n=1 Tax=Aequitasia blattaphilus TaxID=2949332 RepID=A0ABT1EBF1_9FIRM|nr:precorrin-6y C5,15-methyltransferase (decarboxylating) subunit CbiE [Aequitasia blattaphilus]MCP1102171.1 precorrin-6y C5,15-methyltransferase (decarboxylating) subunit CbiE [Aequitasia blattaphilus]MCR8614811.1 precorrin-6y C5,15-methyltransferase (decarboxylating) subunit CbiE [Aequitasia blattaphilus]